LSSPIEIRRGTEQLAKCARSTIGGLLNVSFGNTAEVLLAPFILSRGTNPGAAAIGAEDKSRAPNPLQQRLLQGRDLLAFQLDAVGIVRKLWFATAL
jgi:hypothetical protein